MPGRVRRPTSRLQGGLRGVGFILLLTAVVLLAGLGIAAALTWIMV